MNLLHRIHQSETNLGWALFRPVGQRSTYVYWLGLLVFLGVLLLVAKTAP